MPLLPCNNILTLSRATACATFVRMATRERRVSHLRHKLVSDLSKVLTYGFFDMSYEDDYMEFKADDEPKTEAERLERGRLTKSNGGVGEIMRSGFETCW
jgi:hypothetical protein